MQHACAAEDNCSRWLSEQAVLGKGNCRGGMPASYECTAMLCWLRSTCAEYTLVVAIVLCTELHRILVQLAVFKFNTLLQMLHLDLASFQLMWYEKLNNISMGACVRHRGLFVNNSCWTSDWCTSMTYC